MFLNQDLDILELPELETISQATESNSIILYNDDINTFEWVIECLVNYCNHDIIQAEQCAHIIHFTGKCIVKEGTLSKLKPICETLCEKGLSAEIN